ncbi:MAG: hypothetical protein F6K23_18030 [Okeania sp. SIO2C9]|uniref:hypothetical protein n=1 Tax=Okeania sp. SIO2C9 TaxID=2607791 RepID=UPI0013BEE9B0|nr:hypothetical protein [Okeania sp. SIO2C9]NEQ74776.1 hypothetical protein [Okeania sp. SIO2C9]
MKCLAILNPEKIVKGFRISDFPTADLAELSGAENPKYLNFVMLIIQRNVLLFSKISKAQTTIF